MRCEQMYATHRPASGKKTNAAIALNKYIPCIPSTLADAT